MIIFLKNKVAVSVLVVQCMRVCVCVTDQQHGLFTEQLLLQHLQVSLLLFQLTPDVLLSIKSN